MIYNYPVVNEWYYLATAEYKVPSVFQVRFILYHSTGISRIIIKDLDSTLWSLPLDLWNKLDITAERELKYEQ